MIKTLAHYVGYLEDNLLEAIVNRYGLRLEKIPRKECLLLILLIAADIDRECDQTCRDEIYIFANTVKEKLTVDEREGMLEALVAQLRRGNHAET